MTRLRRGLALAFGGYVLAFHLFALWRRVEEASLLRTEIGLRWLGSALLMVLLWRLRTALRSPRSVLAFTTLALLLHFGAGGPLDPATSHEVPRPLLVALPFALVLGGLSGAARLNGSSSRRGALLPPGRKIPREQSGSPIRLRLLRVLSPRAPPHLAFFRGR